MNPITHALAGWLAAECHPGLTRRERGIVTFAGVAPDLDGFGMIPEYFTRDTDRPLLWWSEYHHILAHNLPFAVLVAIVAFSLALVHRTATAILAFVAVHLHILGDLVGSRGPDGYEWPIPYLYPFRPEYQWSWSGQWVLNAWPNMAITVALLGAVFVLAWRRGYSPLELISRRADVVFVKTLRRRFPRHSVDDAVS